MQRRALYQAAKVGLTPLRALTANWARTVWRWRACRPARWAWSVAEKLMQATSMRRLLSYDMGAIFWSRLNASTLSVVATNACKQFKHMPQPSVALLKMCQWPTNPACHSNADTAPVFLQDTLPMQQLIFWYKRDVEKHAAMSHGRR